MDHPSFADNTHPWMRRLGLLAIISVVTSAGIYGIGRQQSRQAETFTATATVYHPESSTSRRGHSARSSEERLSGRNIGELLRDHEGDPSDIADLGANLRVSSAHSGAAGWVRTTLTYSGATAENTLHTVNRLARRLAEHERLAAETSIREALTQARASTEQARQELLAAECELEQFVRRHFEQLRQRNGNLPHASSSSLQAPICGPPLEQPDAVENPEWCDLRDQVARLRRQREEMLSTRTPLHPAVRDLDTELARLEPLLASVPQYLPGRRGIAPATSTPTPEYPGQTPLLQGMSGNSPQFSGEDITASEGFAVRRDAVEKARQKYEEMASLEQRVRQRELQLAAPEVQWAEQCQRTSGAAPGNRLVWMALAAGLAMATGVGMVWAGATSDLMLSSVADVQAALPVPVMGVVSVPGVPGTSTVQSPVTAGTSTLMVIFGVAIVVICVASTFLFL